MTKKVFLAAGGTGGHIFAAQSLAEELVKGDYEVTLITDKRFRDYEGAFGSLAEQVDVIEIQAGSSSLKGLFKTLIGIIQCLRLFIKHKPDIVVGFGGHCTFPPMLMALAFRKKSIVHEQNAVLGKTNKFFVTSVDRVATSFQQTSGFPKPMYVTYTGNPIRAKMAAIKDMPYPDPNEHIHILVFGGSQGASVFTDIVPEAIKQLPPEIRNKMSITQQCTTEEEVIQLKEAYQEMGIEATVQIFFSDMPEQVAKSNLIMSRAGAASVAEIMTIGVPSILIPYPYATDDHQTVNAKAITENGYGWIIHQIAFNEDTLAEKFEEILSNPIKMIGIATLMKSEPYINPASKLANLVKEVLVSERQKKTVERVKKPNEKSAIVDTRRIDNPVVYYIMLGFSKVLDIFTKIIQRF